VHSQQVSKPAQALETLLNNNPNKGRGKGKLKKET
jgi:hypothetical protein